jgi:membrane associated rhomboid family serine protease
MPRFKKWVLLKRTLALSAFPVLISAVMLLPAGIRDAMKLHIQDPSWWQFLTSGFVHNSFSHYLDNLIAFLILLLVQGIIVYRMRAQKAYAGLLFFTMLSFPIVSSIVKLVLYRGLLPIVRVSCGSSGIISAMIGFTPVLWLAYMSKAARKNLFSLAFFSAVLAYIVLSFVIIYFPYHRNLLLALVLVALIAVFAFAWRGSLKRACKTLLKERSLPMLFYLIFLPLFFLASPVLTFPLRLIQGDSSVDFFSHYIGFIYGFWISFVFFRMKTKPNL